ncbi:hypothetical protein AAEX37_00318 [Oligella sp. MSHR50489EDL]|uniref:hypothetical protein n=1 Tax=Oligella sp. MSHR50489EDL TaxID=3139409 RepID=UPI003D812F4F
MNYRHLLIVATLLPMTVYYLLLAFAPQTMATASVLAIPASLFWGVATMFWGVLMAILYVFVHAHKGEGQ